MGPRAERVFRDDGVPIHGCAIERRYIDGRNDIDGDHAAAGIDERHTLGPRDRRGRVHDQAHRVVVQKRFRYWPHLFSEFSDNVT